MPPWYRLNYYTPTTEEIDNGTAYQNIPSSHAWRGYGVPDGYPGTTGYGMPASQTNAQQDVDFVVAVQRELRRRGFYNGIVNGISDAATRSAIRSFEASAGLPVTGVIGVPLLRTFGFF
ncbi:MAG: peptidoglycan-binding domain-containing protein [Verrucomicrobiota bacterium]